MPCFVDGPIHQGKKTEEKHAGGRISQAEAFCYEPQVLMCHPSEPTQRSCAGCKHQREKIQAGDEHQLLTDAREPMRLLGEGAQREKQNTKLHLEYRSIF